MAHDTLRMPGGGDRSKPDEVIESYKEMYTVLKDFYNRTGDPFIKDMMDRADRIVMKLPPTK
jgi:hypothetical protein